MSEESINYKGYTIEPCLRKERLVYRISNNKGKFLISRPNQVIGKFKYGKIGDMIRQIMTNRTGLFVALDNKYQHVAITHQLTVDKSKKCIEDVINGTYRL